MSVDDVNHQGHTSARTCHQELMVDVWHGGVACINSITTINSNVNHQQHHVSGTSTINQTDKCSQYASART